MDKTASKPMPCPFCGEHAERVDIPSRDPRDGGDENAGGSYIVCTGCGNGTKIYFGEKEGLLESWNRRPPSEPQAHPAPVSKEPGEKSTPTYTDLILKDWRNWADDIDDDCKTIKPDVEGTNLEAAILGIQVVAQQIRGSIDGYIAGSQNAPLPEPGTAYSEHRLIANIFSYILRSGGDLGDAKRSEAAAIVIEHNKSAPLPEARGVEAAAREIFDAYREDSLRKSPTSPEEVAVIIRRHTHAPGEGWQWVPKELNPEMTTAILEANVDHERLYPQDKIRRSERIWSAALAAAPATQEDEPRGEKS